MLSLSLLRQNLSCRLALSRHYLFPKNLLGPERGTTQASSPGERIERCPSSTLPKTYQKYALFQKNCVLFEDDGFVIFGIGWVDSLRKISNLAKVFPQFVPITSWVHIPGAWKGWILSWTSQISISQAYLHVWGWGSRTWACLVAMDLARAEIKFSIKTSIKIEGLLLFPKPPFDQISNASFWSSPRTNMCLIGRKPIQL